MRLTVRHRIKTDLDHELIWLSVSLGGLALAASWFALRLPWPHCIFLSITGLPCLTCGATRSAIAFFHLDFWSAWKWNPHQQLHVVSDRIQHSANLPIKSLSQDNAQSRLSNWMKPRDLGALTIQKNAAQKLWRVGAVPLSI